MHPTSSLRTRSAVAATTALVVVALIAWFLPATRAAEARARGVGSPQSTPAGYDQYLVMIANGSWNVFEPHPVVPGCQMMFCDGDYFFHEIMGRSGAEVAATQAAAKEHFEQRFGIDVDAAENEGRILFRSWMADPRFNYRVHSWGDRRVPPEGYEIRDGGWAIFITDPDGYTLGGETAGIHIPAGAFAFYGDYNILVTNASGRVVEEVVLSYRADTFMTFNEFGDMAFSCQLSDDGFASGETTGFAQGFAHMDMHPDGWLNLNIRNVATFGDAGLRR